MLKKLSELSSYGHFSNPDLGPDNEQRIKIDPYQIQSVQPIEPTNEERPRRRAQRRRSMPLFGSAGTDNDEKERDPPNQTPHPGGFPPGGHPGAIFNFLDILCKRLEENDESLTDLDLSWKGIGDEGVIKIAAALQGNSTLTRLKLWSNSIGDPGVIEIACSLLSNRSLLVLDLDFNQITDVGVSALASSLRENSSLRELMLSGNKIGDEGAGMLADAIRENISLNKLFLEGNQITAFGSKMFESAMEDNPSLSYLALPKTTQRIKAMRRSSLGKPSEFRVQRRGSMN